MPQNSRRPRADRATRQEKKRVPTVELPWLHIRRRLEDVKSKRGLSAVVAHAQFPRRLDKSHDSPDRLYLFYKVERTATVLWQKCKKWKLW